MADEDDVVLEHPDVKDDDGNPATLTFRKSEGFWSDKLAQIEVYKQAGWTEAPKTRRKAALEDTKPAATGDQK